jgi:mannosyltransferase
VPLLLLVALGVATFADRRIAVVIVAASAGFGLFTSIPNISTQRSQAIELSQVLARAGKPGDIVAYCPDQLGPDASRLLPANEYRQITFPRGTGPQFVNWINYEQVVGSASPQAFAHRLEQMSEPDHHIWYVWAPGYQTYAAKCEQIESALLQDTKLGGNAIFGLGPYYEAEELVEFAYRSG